jgi:hypothetical protein
LRRPTLPTLLAAAALAGAAFAAPPLLADLKLPQKSPAEKISHDIGTTTITLAYHRPGVRGRTVWGDLVPFDRPWRLGANEVTSLTLTHPARISGRDVPAGKWALLAIPGTQKWTLILNRDAEQWGAYFYKPEQDLLRFEVPVEPGPFTEWLTFAFVPVSAIKARLDFAWEKIRFQVPIEVDVPGIVWKQVDEALAASKGKPEEWSVTLQAARYALEEGTRLDEAMTWCERSMEIKESFWNLEMKGLLLHRAGKTTEAVGWMERAKVAAKGKAPQEYSDGLDKTMAGWKK